ncbi:MAG: tRNA dihydrouridine synthase DusB [Finegoldia magna]|uniref:tRNA dihydrouridine synthase DusB n=2 Tax=Finegoldia TaxID=150022 RepID=UPI0028FE20D8|nr:tRNA dihydrouridine synthase DusB [Finegoldia magna]MDU1832286.1 tRNA dihydrouridine synthase DusB [Finegoldia magna]MDU1878316.1 tRNA dihydrouridine synthase DusB [Finegoldia magna]MDU2575340.1 tRNA dihydrouridine synthase DusB [Finegoldia magna]MDU4571283.1 tRNA dihydrouridine synthase DusB [Finegoldia magna]MDU7478483.1 tRNA dihydrouridine synthase DusB [Finegoldia magna]
MIKEKLNLNSNLFLAPLAGVTDIPFRIICGELGAGLCFTEMISAKALYYDDKKTKKLLDTDPRENSTSVQIFGHEPEIMAYATRFLTENYNFKSIDINMGCPAPKIFKNGDGSALMGDLNLAEDVIRACKNNTDLPVSVKFRLGIDENSMNYLQLAQICERLKVDYVTLHARTRKMFYSGEADWYHIKRLVEAVNIPVFGNGDCFTKADIKRNMEYSNCDGVLLARGAMQNPFIFSDDETKTKEEVIDTIKKHMQLKLEFYEERRAILEMRKHIQWYLKGFKNSNRVKNEINQLTDIDQIYKILDEFKNE